MSCTSSLLKVLAAWHLILSAVAQALLQHHSSGIDSSGSTSCPSVSKEFVVPDTYQEDHIVLKSKEKPTYGVNRIHMTYPRVPN